jgi:hypothetical protein
MNAVGPSRGVNSIAKWTKLKSRTRDWFGIDFAET